MFAALGRLDRLQRARTFKVAASIVALALIAGVFVAALVTATAPGFDERVADINQRVAEEETVPLLDQLALQAATLASAEGARAVAIGFAAVAAGTLFIIWLGLALSYLGILGVGLAVGVPLALAEPTAGVGRLIVAVVPLALIMLTLIEAARLALSGPWPIAAVARNVLNEAVRMKISVVFIVVLLLLMAAIPNALNDDQPLRYRVQQWLTYGVGLTYAVLTLLTSLLAVGTVAFEQRDRIIWQTVTKPIKPWEYVLGKWLGVVTLNALLLAVIAGGVYLFTEYLRHQPAEGERAYYVDELGRPTKNQPELVSKDRRILEEQVLVSQVAIEPERLGMSDSRLDFRELVFLSQNPDASTERVDDFRREQAEGFDAMIEGMVRRRLEDAAARDIAFQPTADTIRRIRQEVLDELFVQSRSAGRGEAVTLLFDLRRVARDLERYRELYERRTEPLLQEAIAGRSVTPEQRQMLQARVIDQLQREGSLPPIPELTLEYTIQSGSNDPTSIYEVAFALSGIPHPPPQGRRQVSLDTAQTLRVPGELIPRDGFLQVQVLNSPANPRGMTIPPDGIEMLYAVGGYELNFARVMALTWAKLAFIAAVGIAAGTFLSFPVACLVTLGVLFMAESSSYLASSLEYFAIQDTDGEFKPGSWLVRQIAAPVAWAFGTYSDMKPIERLASGRLVAWAEIARHATPLAAWAAGVLAIGWAVFRKRELATYSGQ